MEGTSLLKNVNKQKWIINNHFNRDVFPISMAGRNSAYSSGIIFKFNGKTWKYTNIPNFVAYLAGYDSTLLNNPYFFDLSGDPYETTNLIDSSDFNIQNAVTYGISLLQKSFSEGVPSFVDTVSSNYCIIVLLIVRVTLNHTFVASRLCGRLQSKSARLLVTLRSPALQ